MGLNWAQGAANLAQGADAMAKQQNWQAEMHYKEVAEQNRQRFAAEQAQTQREFLTAQEESRRTWEEPFKTRALNIQERSAESQATSAELAGELKIISQHSLDTLRAIQNTQKERELAVLESREGRAGKEAIAGNIQEQMQIDADALAVLAERRDKILRSIRPQPQGIKDKAKWDYEAGAAMLNIKNDDISVLSDQRSKYLEAYEMLHDGLVPLMPDVGTEEGKKTYAAQRKTYEKWFKSARETATDYAKMLPEVRDKVISHRDNLIRDEGQNSNQAFINSVNAFKGGGVPQASAAEAGSPQAEPAPAASAPAAPKTAFLPKPSTYDFAAEAGMSGKERVASQAARVKELAAFKEQQEELAKQLAQKQGLKWQSGDGSWGVNPEQRKHFMKLALEIMEKQTPGQSGLQLAGGQQ